MLEGKSDIKGDREKEKEIIVNKPWNCQKHWYSLNWIISSTLVQYRVNNSPSSYGQFRSANGLTGSDIRLRLTKLSRIYWHNWLMINSFIKTAQVFSFFIHKIQKRKKKTKKQNTKNSIYKYTILTYWK